MTAWCPVRLQLLPGQRSELAAVLRQRADDGVAAVENRGAAVLGDRAAALDDDAAEDPSLSIHVEIAFDVDQAAIDEGRIQGQVAVHVEQPFAARAVEPEARRPVAP